MATFVSEENATPPAPGTPSDMSAWDLSDYATATVLTSTATKFQIQISGIIWTFTGSNFTYDGNDLLATGTLSRFQIEQSSTVYADVSDFTMDVASVFKPFMASRDTAGFQHAVFSGNDDITDAYHAIGYEGNDTITNAVIAYGGAGADVITVLATADTMIDGGNDNDILIFTGGTLPIDRIFGGSGNDLLKGSWTVATGFRTDTAGFERIGDSTITGTSGKNDIDLRSVVKDAVYSHVDMSGGGDDDRLWGVSDGASNLYGGDGDDRLDTGTADDHLYGGLGDDFMVSGFGDDVIEDLSGNDKARGAAGNDIITVADGGDLVSGDEDNDILTALGPGTATLRGGAGMDIMTGFGAVTYIGGRQDDVFNLHAGNIKAEGDPGGDTFNVVDATTLSTMLSIDGGSGLDTIVLAAVGGPVTLSTALNSVEFLDTDGGRIVTADQALGAGDKLTVYGGDSQALDFNGSAETDGRFILDGTDFDDTLTGGSGKDEFRAGGGRDTIGGGGGNDLISFTFDAGTLDAGDRVDGGSGIDALNLSGLYAGAGALTFAADTIVNVETLVLLSGNDGGTPFSYDLTLADGNIARSQTLTVDTTDLRGNGPATVDASAETDGKLSFVSGDAQDTFIGGSGRDTFDGGGAGDALDGGGGADLFLYVDIADSTGAAFDTIAGFNASQDNLGFQFAVGGVDTAVNGGTLSRGAFDHDLAAAVGSSQLAGNHAVLFSPDAGFYAGHMFLVVDANGDAGYQGGEDFVIELTGATNLQDLANAFVVS